jgi:hypothetical protein
MAGFKRSARAGVVLLLLISVIAEIFVFNFRYFTEVFSGAPQKTVGASAFSAVAGGTVSSGSLTAANDTVFSFDPDVPVQSLTIQTTGSKPFTLSAFYTDGSFSKSEVDAGEWTVDPAVPGSEQIRFVTAGKCSRVKLWITKAKSDFSITAITLNKPYFRFRFSRALLLFFCLLFLFMLRRKALWADRLEAGSYSARKALLVVFALSGALAVVVYACYGDIQPLTGNVRYSGDCYALLTEAFSHGSLAFLEQPAKALAALANPYDPSLRENIDYIWDSVYYNGHYYCYFGVAPVLTLLLPFKLLTGLYMPTSFACLIYMLALLFAVLFLYDSIVCRWFIDIGRMQFIGGAVAVVFCANLYWLIARPLFYELAVTSALFYLFMGFSLLILAGKANRKKLTLLFSGLFFALMVASRPTYIFYLAAAIPLLSPLFFEQADDLRGVGGILHKIRGIKTQIWPLCAFFVPLIAAAALLMAYNAARFGSPFDFGQRYQLTISDVRYNSLTNLAAIPGGLYHYFFAPLSYDLTFPFFHVALTTPATSAGYYYNQPMAGLFNFPLLLILFAAAYIFRRMGKDRRALKVFAAVLLAMALVVTLLNILLGGVLERYTLDIGPVLVFVSLILWFEAVGYFNSKGAGVPAAKLFFAVCIVTAVISTLCSCVGEGDSLISARPQLYETIVQIVEFWR